MKLPEIRWHAAVLAAAVLAIAAAAVSAAAPHAARVAIHDFAYGPPTMTVPVGSTVTWTNRDEEVHTVTAAGGAFGSAGLDRNETFSRTFTARGTYDYFCALHPQMKGRIVVR
jgi:plastocyanin